MFERSLASPVRMSRLDEEAAGARDAFVCAFDRAEDFDKALLKALAPRREKAGSGRVSHATTVAALALLFLMI